MTPKSTPDALALPEVEARQRRLLARNRWFATGLLAAAGLAFVLLKLAFPVPGFWPGLATAATEAAIVGALADWFAVTALFRHPLGLPIPHTAIVPRSKDRIGEGLGSFVAGNFLDPDLVAARVKAIGPARRIADALSGPGVADWLAGRIAGALPEIIRSVEDKDLRAFVGRALGEQLRDLDLAPFLGRMLGAIVSGGHHQAMVERLVEAALDRLSESEPAILEAIETRSRWWVPKSVDRRLATSVSQALRDLLIDLRISGSPARDGLDRSLADLARSLERRGSAAAEVENAKRSLLDRPEVAELLGAVWDEVSAAVIADVASPRSRTREAIATGLASVATTLRSDAGARAAVDGVVERLAGELARSWRHEIGRFIADVVKGWDAGTVTARLELAVGPDLQYVRISGTLVAATVGSALYLATRYFG